MSAFKKFTVGCGALSLLSAAFYVFFQFMAYSSLAGDFSKIAVLKRFFSVANHRDFRPYLCLMALLLISLTVSIALRRYPALCVAVSALPLAYAMVMLDSSRFYERPMLYVALCAVHWIGNLWEYACLARLDDRPGAATGAVPLALLTAALALYLYLCFRMPQAVLGERINFLEQTLLDALSKGADLAVCLRPTWIYAGLACIGFFLRELPMLQAALSVLPLIDVWVLFGAERLSPYGAALVTLATVYTIFCIVMTLSYSPRVEKRK